MDLDRVYVSLDTDKRVETGQDRRSSKKGNLGGEMEINRPLSALEAIIQNRRAVLLGNPGSGKSTFLNHLSLCLAAHALEPNRDWLKRLPGWPAEESESVPISVTLRDFARQLPENLESATPSHLWQFIVQRLEKQNLGFVQEPLLKALDSGKAIVLLDGLDEVPTQEQRRVVRDAVQRFTERHSPARILVTCRTLSYQDSQWRLAGFPEFALAPFDEQKIDQFICAWFADLLSLGRIKAQDEPRLVQGLKAAVRRTDLRNLAPNPLLLTVMAVVHTHKGRLPDARALLYEDAIDILLWRWDQIRFSPEGEPVGLGQLLSEAKRSEVDLKRILWRLAFDAHRTGGAQDKLADIGEMSLQNALRDLHPSRDRGWSGRMVEMMRMRAGLLLEREPNVFTFPHRTFQEYLAGANVASLSGFAGEAVRLFESGSFWREAILLAVGRLVYLSGDTDKPRALVAEFCPPAEPSDDTAWRKAWLAGDILNEMGLARAEESSLGRELVERVRHRLMRLLEVGALSPVERAAAGTALGKLGDQRKGVGVKNGLPDIDWIEIPAGPFIMGTPEGDGFDEERPQFMCDIITRPFMISRYPVTVGQYQCFVDAGGYRQERWWVEAKAAELWKMGKIMSWYWDPQKKASGEEWREGPGTSGEPFLRPNHPVMDINWYEAIAFCRWLSVQLKGLSILLPSEAEWERAARHVDGRRYPWGDESDRVSERCNMADSQIGHTCAVGMFSSGLSACGAADMAGNVWEWTRSLWGKEARKTSYRYPYRLKDGREQLDAPAEVARVLRGGAFYYDTDDVRCAFRNRNDPVFRFRGIGFRVVASPFASER